MAEFDDLESLDKSQFDLNHEVEDWLESLQKADQMFYNLMTVEIWSIAQTMDELNPGFWAHYMRNRQAIVQQQIQARQSLDPRPQAEPLIRKPPPRRPSPFDPNLKRKLLDEAATERVSLFSQDLEQALPLVRQSARPEPVSVVLNPEDLVAAAPEYPLATPTEGTILDLEPTPTGLDLAGEEIHVLEPTTPPLSPPPDKPSLTAGILLELPHLMRVPMVKVLPLESASAQRSLGVSIACWLTRHFLLPDPEQKGFWLKRQQTLTIAPGQSVICRLGFQLLGISSPVRVTLAKPLRSQPGLTMTWVSDPGPILGSSEVTSTEASVQLTNQGSQSYPLQAGQALCTLELTCLVEEAVALPQSRPMSPSFNHP